MGPQFLPMIFFYWLVLAGVFFLAGAFVSRWYITGPSGLDICRIGPGEQCLGEKAARFMVVIAVLTLAVHSVHLVLHAAVMTGTPIGQIQEILPIFIMKTKYGRFALYRTVILTVLIILSFMSLGKGTHRKTTVGGVFFSVLLIASFSMSGHQGTKGYLTLPFALDLFHSGAVVCWIGGLFFIRLCFLFFGGEGAGDLTPVFVTTINRLSRMATVAVAIAGLSGLGLVLANIHRPEALVQTPYGITLSIKMIAASIVFLLGGINKFIFLPQLNKGANDTSGSAPVPFRHLLSAVSAEVFGGLIILLATAVLTHLSPEG